MHGRPHAVAVAQVQVVPHANFIAVIDDGCSRHCQKQTVHQFDATAIVLEKRRKPPADAEIEPRTSVGGVHFPQVVALAVGHHFQCQLVMVAQKNRPLAALGRIGRLADDVGDRKAIFLCDRHVHARHQREMKHHVTFVAGAEIFLDILRPLVRFGKQHSVGIVLVHHLADVFQNGVRFGEVFARGAFALNQIGHGVKP